MLPVNNLPIIYLISDGTITNKNFAARSKRFLKLVAAAVKAKIPLVQIREKELSICQTFELTSRAIQITRNSETLLLVNDRADVALAANANGVQLTANSLSVAIVRRSFPKKNFIIGASAHSLPEIQAAAADGADFATFSPIFATPSKEKYNLPAQGIEKLQVVCQTVREKFPVIALGGINEMNFSQVLAAGASGIAAIRLFGDAQKLPAVVKLICDN